MNNLLSAIKQKNVENKLNIIAPFFQKAGKILDFGCGDLLLDEGLLNLNPHLDISGVDVVDFGYRPKGVKFYKYNGENLPFKSKSFDTVLIFHVLHHCPSPVESLKECIRVSKERIIIVEPTYRKEIEVPIMRFVDWLYNFWKSRSIEMNYKFFSKDYWERVFREDNLSVDQIVDIDKYPQVVPFGRAYLFSLCVKGK